MTTSTRKRRPIVAALLSLLLPGLGQLYAGKGRSAVLWMAIAVFLYLVVHWGLLPIDRILLLPSGFWLLMSAVALAVVWQIWVIVDAFISARRAGITGLKRYQHWYVYTALAILFLGPQFVVDTDRLKPLPAFSIPSGSMSPTLRVGDRFIASGNWFKTHLPTRGDLAVHASTRDPGVVFVKRIIGLPGDRVQYRGGRLYINGVPVERTGLTADEVAAINYVGDRIFQVYWEQLPGGPRYVIAETGDNMSIDSTEEFVVPPRNVFLLGDNRDNSADSRSDGFLPLELLRARPVSIFWSMDWRRIGMRVE